MDGCGDVLFVGRGLRRFGSSILSDWEGTGLCTFVHDSSLLDVMLACISVE